MARTARYSRTSQLAALATVLDLHTREIVGGSMRPSLHVEIALDALEMAIQRQRPA